MNERHYGALQGKDKKETAATYGAEQTNMWRRSYAVPPPPVGPNSPEHLSQDRRYARLPPDVLPGSECLADVVTRVLTYWHDRIVPQLGVGLTVLVVARGNSLRALVKHLEAISEGDIAELTSRPAYRGAIGSTIGSASSTSSTSATPRPLPPRPPR